MTKTIKVGWTEFKNNGTQNLSLKDRINNMRIILKDIEANSIENWTAAREDFYDVDDQCQYLENQLSYLLFQIESTDIRRDL